MIQFEDIKVKAPKDIDSFLKVYYGDYMKLPPVEQRVPSHGYALYKENSIVRLRVVSLHFK